MADLKDLLKARNLLGTVTLSPGIDALLQAAQIVDRLPADPIPAGTTSITGHVQLGTPALPLPGTIQLGPFGPAVPFTLSTADKTKAFRLLIDLTAASGASIPLSTPIPGLQAATRDSAGVMTVQTPGDVTLTGVGVSIVVEAPTSGAAVFHLSSKTDLKQPDDIAAVALSKTPVLVGDSKLGLDLPNGLILDTSSTDVPNAPAPVGQLGAAVMPSTVKGWQGFVVRAAKLYLPATLPGIGDATASVDFDIGTAPAGIALVSVLDIPEDKAKGRPKMTVRVECVDPTATGLDGFVPTLVEMALTLPVAQTQTLSSGGAAQTLTLKGDPVTVRMRLARAPATGNGATLLTAALETTGDKGLFLLQPSGPGDTAAMWAIGAAGFVTALVANKKLEPNQTKPAPGGMAELMAGGAVLSALLAGGSSPELMTKGRIKVNAVELDSSGPGLSLDQNVQFKLDYSVDVPIKPLDVGTLSIKLDPVQLLRIRLRDVTVSYDRTKQGLDRFALDVAQAKMDIEDPGRWLIDGPGSLFDVVGTRSGRGSTWIEVDLRFKLDLGPLKVSGATVRATLGDDGAVSVGLRGLDAAFDIPKVVTMTGGLTLGPDMNQFSAELAVGIVPLNLAASAWLSVSDSGVLVALAADLPAPIPLGPTGFGLFGIGATFGLNAKLDLPNQSPFALLEWKNTPKGFAAKSGALSFGAQASVGTLPDMSFSVGAKAGLFVTVPDLDILGALDASFLSGPVSLAKQSEDPSKDPGQAKLVVQGAARVGEVSGLQFALKGHFAVPRLLDATIPVAGSFPPKSADWYVYVGADGAADPPGEGRGIGPVRMSVLPDLIKATADAYLMVRGHGITKWPAGRSDGLSIQDGMVVAFGFHAALRFGPKPWAWAELSGGADVLIATSPTVIAGFGNIEGSLHLGPVSFGVSATLSVLDYDGKVSGKAEVCGRIHLVFVTIHRCATLRFGDKADSTIPPPVSLPTDRVDPQPDGSSILRADVQIVDDRYRLVAWLPTTDNNDVPVVWPDALIRIGCAWSPGVLPDAAKQFGGAAFAPTAKPIGSLMLSYAWRMKTLTLSVQEPSTGTWTPVSGPLSAAWQYGKAGDADTLAQAVELILLKPDKALWLEAVHDPAKLPVNPLDALATSCRVRGINPAEGWLLGSSARLLGGGCALPPEFLSADAKQSRVGGRMVFGVITGLGLVSLNAAQSGLPGTLLTPPQIVPASVQFERSFTAALGLPTSSGPTLDFQATLILDDPIVSGELRFLLLGKPIGNATAPMSVNDEVGPWTFGLTNAFAPDATSTQFSFTLPPGRTVRRLTLRWKAPFRAALLGLKAITAKAQAAAKAQADGAAAQSKANEGAVIPGDANGADKRCLLLPGRKYRLDLDFEWQGTRYTQNDKNERVLDPDVTGGTNPSQWSDKNKDGPCRRSYFFRTAAAVAPAPSVPSQTDPAFIDQTQRRQLVTAQDHFEPRMLLRYLGGSEPGQGEVDRFWADPIRFHWTVGHVPRLALAFGWTLLAVVRRVDAGEDAAKEVRPVKLLAPTNPKFLTAGARRRAAVAATAPCPVPVEGGTWQAAAELVPQSWYEAHVRAAKAGAADVALPGVTFRTSRWRDAPDMLAGLGFPAQGRGVAAGDLPVPAGKAATLAAARGDGAFDDALRQLGFDSWSSAVSAPRVSLMWEPAGTGWALAGVLIESPEPIERAGRTANAALNPALAPGQFAAFGVKRVDGSGGRLLFLATQPFVPTRWPLQPVPVPGPIFRPDGGGGRLKDPVSPVISGRGKIDTLPLGPGGVIGRPRWNNPSLVLTLDDLRPTETAQPTVVALSGSMLLPVAPAFAEEFA